MNGKKENKIVGTKSIFYLSTRSGSATEETPFAHIRLHRQSQTHNTKKSPILLLTHSIERVQLKFVRSKSESAQTLLVPTPLS